MTALTKRLAVVVLLLSASTRAADPGANRAADVVAGCTWADGAIVRGPTESRRLALVFTGHEFAEGGAVILDTLARHEARASFFLTGAFLDNPDFAPLIRRMVAAGHYLGPHSDRHLLLCDWTPRKTLLVSTETFAADLGANCAKIRRFTSSPPRWFLPPYEHYDATIARWTEACGLRLVNYTPGTRSAADYTAENAANFVSSDAIARSILERDKLDPHGFNGFLLLLHLGSGPGRTDKMHLKFPALLDALAARHYAFVRIDELLEAPEPRR